MLDSIPYLVGFLSFAAVTIVAFLVGQNFVVQSRIHKRLTAPSQSVLSNTSSLPALAKFIARYFDEKRFGVDETLRGKLRRELVKAGYFNNNALNYYIFARMAVVVLLPAISYVAIEAFTGDMEWYFKLVIMSVAFLLAIVGPDAFLARQHRLHAHRHQLIFPDLLDLLVVCVDAGLSLEGALDRITIEMMKQDRVLGSHLMMMRAEMRAGRSTIDALNSLSERLGFDEARSFVLVLRQSVELGSDVGEALRVFSDEMRDKRLLRAEENANKLPVKMVGPMAGLIFPVIMAEIMLPLGLRVVAVLP
jgi:tight adherence protein C